MNFRTLVAFAGCAFVVGCGSSSSGAPADETGGSDPGVTGGAGGGTGGATGYGGAKTGGSTGSGGATTGSGGATTGGGGSTTAGTGGSTGACTPAATPTTYTVSGTNNASWAGSGNGDTIVLATTSGYLPMAASDCPLDPDMANVAAYKDKIFNGCLDECAGDTNMASHGIATVLDWTHTASGWTVAQVSSTLHWTGMWEPAGTKPTMLVFWIKGAVGCEQERFTVAIHSHLTDKLSAAVKVPIAISTSWQRVVIPWASFKVPASPNPDALAFSSTGGAGKVTVFIDQAYLSKTVSPP